MKNVISLVVFFLSLTFFADASDNHVANEWKKVNSFMRALRQNKSQEIDSLLTSDLDVNLKARNGLAPLHYAAKKGDVKIAKRLFRRSAEVNLLDRSNRTALYIASLYGHRDFVVHLLSKKALSDFIVNKETALHVAVKNGHDEVVEFLSIKRNKDINILRLDDRKSALHLAAESGNETILRTLISHGAELDARDISGATPLFLAANSNRDRCVEILMSEGANHSLKATVVDNKGSQRVFSPSEIAAEKGYDEVVTTIGSMNEIRAVSKKSLLQASFDNDVLEAREIIETTQNFGALAPCLEIAAMNGYAQLVSLFLSHGANSNTYYPEKEKSVLFLASENNQPEIVELLLNGGAFVDFEKNGKKNRTALHIAAKKGHLEVAKKLKEIGHANIGLRDSCLRTAKGLAFRDRTDSSRRELRRFFKEWWDEDSEAKATPLVFIPMKFSKEKVENPNKCIKKKSKTKQKSQHKKSRKTKMRTSILENSSSSDSD